MKLNKQWKITLELLCTLLYVFVFPEKYLNLYKVTLVLQNYCTMFELQFGKTTELLW